MSQVTIGGNVIYDIINEDVDSSTWKKIEIPNGGSCFSILARLRDGNSFKISHLPDGSRYLTVDGMLSLDIGKSSGETLFYVQTSSTSTTLEVLLLE